MINQPIDEALSHDYRDWSYNKHNRRRSKRDLFTRRKANFIRPPEDNEDLWLSSSVPQTPIYIPTINRFGSPDLANGNIAMHNHKLGLDSLGSSFRPKQGSRNKENQIPSHHFPSYSFLAPSSYAFPQTLTNVYHYKPKSHQAPSFGTLYGQKSHQARPSLSNLFPNYDANLASNDYSDEMSNRKEEIDLEHREKAAKEPNYFDESEFEDEFNRDEPIERKYPNNRDQEKDFKVNFDKNFDKDFKVKRPVPKPKKGNKKSKPNNKRKHRPSIKKMIDTSQVEREGEEAGRMGKESDAKEQKLVRITRQITVLNRNLFEDSFDLRSIGDKSELLDKEGLLESGQDLLDDSAANLLGGQDLVENADLAELSDENKNMPRLKKKRSRKGTKGKRKSPAGNRKKSRKRPQGKTFSPANKRRSGKRRGTKSK